MQFERRVRMLLNAKDIIDLLAKSGHRVANPEVRVVPKPRKTPRDGTEPLIEVRSDENQPQT